MGPLRPPTDDHPATMLRWVRRVNYAMLPLGLVMALALRAGDSPVWWAGLVVAAFAFVSVATIGPAIRRAEEHGPNDPATRPARVRRAERMTLALFGGFGAAAVAVGYAFEGAGLAITLAAVLALGATLGIWLFRRWFRAP